jgi:hypothetical protein
MPINTGVHSTERMHLQPNNHVSPATPRGAVVLAHGSNSMVMDQANHNKALHFSLSPGCDGTFPFD